LHRKRLRLEAKREQMAGKAMHWINSQIKAHARQLKQDKLQLKTDLATADRFKGAPFYIELRCDFRGRVYPVPYFHYQRGDPIRSLFLLDRGEPIGSEQAVRRLKDYAASCWGHGWDKKTLPERRHWVDENWSRLIEPTAALKSKEWFKAENPFLFLAACIELVAVRQNGLSHITHLPISFDGLANGMVHYCCLTRQDPIGLLAANTTATPAVDPYRLVAERVNPDNPDRALAKQPTGTFFYGATNIRRADQIREVLEDRDDVSLPSDPSEAGKLYYTIGEEHRKAIEDLFPGAKETMKFLQGIARELAKHSQKPLQFTTPSGFPLINLYEEPEYKTVNSILRGARVRRKIAIGNKQGKIRVGKSKNAAAANVIHALDASHMMLTAIACKRAVH
jgi:DNA-directed RNA polymerase